jgi:hypothetical protein
LIRKAGVCPSDRLHNQKMKRPMMAKHQKTILKCVLSENTDPFQIVACRPL